MGSYSEVVEPGGVYTRIQGRTDATVKSFAIDWPPGMYERIFARPRRVREGTLTAAERRTGRRPPDGSTELLIDLGRMTLNYYLRNQQWREVFIAGPTVNAARNQGNDFPGFYYYDPHAGYEWVVMVRGSVNWRTTRCIRRLNRGLLEIGLASSSPLPRSAHLVPWFRKRTSVPTKWDALTTLVDKSFELLPLPSAAGPEPDWTEIAKACLLELRKTKLLRQACAGVTGFVSMLQSEQHGNSEEKPSLELMCNASIAKSLLLIAHLPGFRDAAAIAKPLVRSVIPKFFRDDVGMYVNDLPSKLTEDGRPDVMETWYLLANLHNVLQIAECCGDQRLRDQARRCLQIVTRVVRDLDYILPLFLDVPSSSERGALQNLSCLGIYAAIYVRAANMFASERDAFLLEAERALRILRRFPIDTLCHEPCQLSLAASASHALGETAWRDDFVRLLLMSMYRSGKHAGLFQACAGIMYPAFKENVEAIEPLSSFINDCRLPLREVFALALRNNWAYLCTGGRRMPLPFEALGTREFPRAQEVGIAIYAAGHVLDMARLQCQLAQTARSEGADARQRRMV